MASQLGIAIPNFWFAILLVLAVLGVIFNIVVRTLRRRVLFWIAGESAG